jgi:3-hydroxyacyl-CoA dehydrogenase
LGAGVMGSGIAAHLANAGIPTLLLDIVPKEPTEKEAKAGLTIDSPEVRNRFATNGLKAAQKAKPAAFSHKSHAKWVEVGNFEDDLQKLSDVDWVIEVIVERLDIKLSLFEKIAPFLQEHALLTTNTSGLSIEAMNDGLPETLRPRFFGTHFFNPPRYMHLLEMIPTRDTDMLLAQGLADFAQNRLGKGIVWTKDTPNFVGNRVGVYGMAYILKAMEKHGLTIEEVDALTGKPMGRPKSATFRTADMVGLDIFAHVTETQRLGTTDDAEKDICTLPGWMTDMVKGGLLGQKVGAGFYKRVKENGKTETLTFDPATGEYRPKVKGRFPVLEEIKEVAEPGKRLAAITKAKGKEGAFAWDVTSASFLFAAHRVGEICDDIVSIDRAMRWGFGWEVGPFEMWDQMGVVKSVARMKSDGLDIPDAVTALAASDTPSFYLHQGDKTLIWDFATKTHVELPARPGITVLADLKRSGKVLFQNAEASLIDLGDGVACLEFHSKMNALGGGILSAINKTIADAGTSYDALVIGNQGENFSVGANLMLMLFEALEGNWFELDMMVRAFQKSLVSIKYSPVPVVAAPFGRVLGGGAEVCLHSHRIQASLESYMGLVEVGVGLIPGGGGTKEMLFRQMENCPSNTADPLPFIQKAFETIGMAKVSMSAHEAFDLGFLRRGDRVSMNAERLINDAKLAALDLLETGWTPLKRPQTVRVMGTDGIATIKMMLHNMRQGNYISDHDMLVSEKLGSILCGGEIDPGTIVDEDYLLDLERRAFIELCSNRKTLERIRHTLKTGKPLRN